MEIKFDTYQAMDFTNVWYVVALNTEGNRVQPYPVNGNQLQNWLGYSFEIIVYQLPGQTGPQAAIVQFVTQNSVGGGTYKYPTQPLVYNPQQLQLNANCNGQNTQFCLIIDRHLFSGLAQGAGASPAPSPSATPSVSPSASPTAAPSGSPSPVPTGTPAPPAIAGVWNINWFTITPTGGPQAGGQVIDAPGPLGVNDQTWLPPSQTYDTATGFDHVWNAVQPPGWPQVTPASAQISGGEVQNVP